jgi:hypothetical protein
MLLRLSARKGWAMARLLRRLQRRLLRRALQ